MIIYTLVSAWVNFLGPLEKVSYKFRKKPQKNELDFITLWLT